MKANGAAEVSAQLPCPAITRYPASALADRWSHTAVLRLGHNSADSPFQLAACAWIQIFRSLETPQQTLICCPYLDGALEMHDAKFKLQALRRVELMDLAASLLQHRVFSAGINAPHECANLAGETCCLGNWQEASR
ncbi:uncharacterized [Tachysurus ichikawai]